jgi:hypothetical protein
MSAFTEPISVGIGGRPQRACSSSERGGHGGANGRAWADGPEVAATPRPKCRLELSTGGRTCMVGARRRVRDAAFDAEVFLGIVRGKSMAFVGDSLARNHAGVGSLGAVQGRGAVAATMERHKVTRGGEEERGGEMRGTGGPFRRLSSSACLSSVRPTCGEGRGTDYSELRGRDCSELLQLLAAAATTWWWHSVTCVRMLSRRRRRPWWWHSVMAWKSVQERMPHIVEASHFYIPLLVCELPHASPVRDKICYSQCLARDIFVFAYDCWSQFEGRTNSITGSNMHIALVMNMRKETVL